MLIHYTLVKINKVPPEIFPYTKCLFVCFVALSPKLTAMVIAGRSVYLTTLFPGQANTKCKYIHI